ncbi:hypothetical protein [Nocardiopsis tropica]|uniref:DUF2933 domain-containing protein n=2 Tax=Nocardiopsis tropica TaxID=109330 RepID=A0ABU7KK78_9ACTN|nr:hypothetical protein [Nocardiopsis umidischolae]MEE2049681.1 hypothetical protein [Nocardiopsis umidischolae]
MLYILALLACPVGMGAMMWMMMRRPSGGQAPQQSRPGAQEQELAQLRAEIQDLRTENSRTSAPEGR